MLPMPKRSAPKRPSKPLAGPARDLQARIKELEEELLILRTDLGLEQEAKKELEEDTQERMEELEERLESDTCVPRGLMRVQRMSF